MEQGEEGEINGWDAARDERSNGWPLGLQPVNARLSITSSNFLISTPSLTSFSSSDFDTESTRSFFPEKSTTLGSLIGFESYSQNALVQSHSIEDEKSTRKSNGGNSRNRLWCPLLGCAGGLQEDQLEPSPSLAHLLDKERRGTLSQQQTTSNSVGEHTQEEAVEQEEFHIDETLYNNTCTISSDPSGTSLRVILQQPSSTSPYRSTNWDVCGDLSHHHQHFRGHNRSHSFWPSLCGKLSTSLAN